MAYLDDETSDNDGQPNELYKFEGAFQSYYYTTGPIIVPFDGNDYLPATLERGEVSAGTQADDNLAINIELPISVPLVQQYAFQIAPPSLRLTIYRYHDIGEWIPYWQGFVGQIKVSDGRASLRSPSVLEFALSNNIPTVFYQTICNHVLFDGRCQVSELLWSQATTVSAVSGRTIDVGTIGTLNGVLVGGTATLASGETRMIVAQTGNQITVNYGFSDIAATDAITVRAGCNHDSDCVSRFNNGINYGGFRYIPPDNVFEQGIEPGYTPPPDNTCLPDIPPPDEGWDLKIRYTIFDTLGGAQVQANATPRGTFSFTFTKPNGNTVVQNGTACTPDGPTPSFSNCAIGNNSTNNAGREFRFASVPFEMEDLSWHMLIQHPNGTVGNNTYIKYEYRWWYQNQWTQFTPVTGDGSGGSAYMGSPKLGDLFPRDNYWSG